MCVLETVCSAVRRFAPLNVMMMMRMMMMMMMMMMFIFS